MFGIPAWREVQVRIVTENSRSLHRIVQIILCELLQAIVGSLVDQIALLDPSLDAPGSSDAGETLFAFQHLNPLAILYRADAVVHRGELVAQAGLRRRDVIDLQYSMAPAITGGNRQQEEEAQCESWTQME